MNFTFGLTCFILTKSREIPRISDKDIFLFEVSDTIFDITLMQVFDLFERTTSGATWNNYQPLTIDS